MGNPSDNRELQLLEKFVVDNDELLALETIIGRFNIFDALGIARTEIRHSNFLRFILDPAESHGQSARFLNAVLMDVLKKAPPEKRPLSPIELDGTDFRGVEVKREWHNIDLLITCREPAFLVAIENKVDSSEHSDQLHRYRDTVAQHFPAAARPLFVYLTASGDDPSDDEWVGYTYADLFRVLARVRDIYAAAIGDDVLAFLDHYLKLIGNRFMNDTEPNGNRPTDHAKIGELCERIWKNHRQALQLIYDRVGNPSSGVMAEVEEAIKEDSRWHVFYRASDIVDFVPKDWIGWLPGLGTDRREHPQSWIVLRFSVYEGRLDYYVEVRKMEDSTRRKQIVDGLLSNGTKFGFIRRTSREATGSYTRISGRERVLEFNKDETPDSDAVRKSVKQRLDKIGPYMAELGAYIQLLLSTTAQTSR